MQITRNGKIIGIYTKMRAFAEMPEKEQKEIIDSAAKEANEDQRALVESVHNSDKKDENVYTKVPKKTKSVHNAKKSVHKFAGLGNYGCGCPKGDSITCPKHKRM